MIQAFADLDAFTEAFSFVVFDAAVSLSLNCLRERGVLSVLQSAFSKVSIAILGQYWLGFHRISLHCHVRLSGEFKLGNCPFYFGADVG
ncbi:hypothetical protein D8T39_22085 [Vibrio vulnificus]|uniref:hypothetical protein n=1 Tax=Vibrio vulnificus TaxID=672 RepID=UPI001029D816|nr:hypothetical protein [Vibrio vulnificus]EGQ7997809.1 hypothetical protein [Vibrio vulnificus]RZQ05216.1 hypothetical protein D8T39_22085 [Vibrio vulnificus]